MKRLLLFVLLLFAILACNFAVSGSFAPAPTVQTTFTATAAPVKDFNATITGKLSYPSEFLPPMRVVAFSLTDKKV